MADRLHLQPKHRKVLEALLREHLPDVEVWAYGSRVSGKSHDGSDLDLVLRGPGLNEIPIGQLGDFEEAVRESSIPFLVEARDWARLPERFHGEVERDYKVLIEKKDLPASEQWREYSLGELTDNFDYIRVPVKRADRRSGPYPYYGASGVVDYVDNYLFDGEFLLIAEDGENLRTRNTPIAFLAEGKFWVNNHAHIVQGNHKANTRFLMYALSDLDIIGYLTGSTMPKLTQDNLNRISLHAPPLHEQEAVAHILGTLDDKIELNRRMNETLEAMARVLFKSWFVDFDPVRAKMKGRDPGLPKPLADLFPDRLVDSEIGGIPEGWEVKRLGDLLVLAYGKALKADSRQHDGDVPVYGSNGQVGWHDEGLVRGPGIVVGRKGNPGVVTWVNTGFFCIDTTFYVIAKGNCNSLHFLLHALTDQDLPSIAADSAVPGLNRNLAYMNRQVVPSKEILGHFDTYVGPLFSQGACLRKEAQTLTSLRDALLPKLISGDICLREAEKVVEAVA